jgi:hypothetical protein
LNDIPVNVLVELFMGTAVKAYRAMWKIVAVILTLFLVGCAEQGSAWRGVSLMREISQTTVRCRSVLSSVDHAVAKFQVGDAEARRIPGFSHLRVNRFLAYLGRRFGQSPSGPHFRTWVARLRQLDDRAIRIEIANLPGSAQRKLSVRPVGNRASIERIADTYGACARTAVSRQLATAESRRRLVGAARVADDYSDVAQLAGFFPLTSVPIALGWRRWKDKHLSSFRRSAERLPVRGRLIEWRPGLQSRSALTARRVRAIVERSRDRALGIPEPKGRDRKRLFAAFAPIWQVDVTGQYDRIGHPAWHDNGKSIAINRKRPVVFTRISHAVVDHRILLQLNYSIWFSERPRASPLDALGGNLDGVIWRVTLSPSGRPMIYDSIHACGCYHFLFPVKGSKPVQQWRPNSKLKEVPAILPGLPAPRAEQRVLLRLATATHYLQGIAVVDRASTRQAQLPYQFVDDDALRSLPRAYGGRRSLFGSDGLVAGTERLERFFLWPTGVRSPGAMRQWGHHAIAFAERRHFDDPLLFDQIFKK